MEFTRVQRELPASLDLTRWMGAIALTAAIVSAYFIAARLSLASAIEQLKTLGHDDDPNVANLIGYSYRKLGDYKLSQVWYERALKANPNHVPTWQYYGLWQIEQGFAAAVRARRLRDG